MRKSKNEELGRISAEEYKATEKMSIVVVLDNIRSMNNIGSAFRTSDAFLIEQIILTGITAQPPHREINKTALGATESVPWQYFDKVSGAMEFLKQKEYQIMAIEQAHESTLLHEFTPKQGDKYALVFGNEVKGVSDEVMQVADDCLEIPQKGSKHSLNISVSIGIILWDFAQKLKVF
jgi:23S rRNA (guanosine2251-2'-O)-methyltransferase